MELKVKENNFYILINKNEKSNQMSVFDELSTSVKSLKELMKKGSSSNDLELMSIQYEEEQFKVKAIPWNIIAMELVKE